MIPRTVINLRASYASNRFGDDASRDAYEQRCDEARRRQTVRFAVAPDQTLKVKGRWLVAGDAVDPGELSWEAFERALRTGVILEAYHLPEPPRAA